MTECGIGCAAEIIVQEKNGPVADVINLRTIAARNHRVPANVFSLTYGKFNSFHWVRICGDGGQIQIIARNSNVVRICCVCRAFLHSIPSDDGISNKAGPIIR